MPLPWAASSDSKMGLADTYWLSNSVLPAFSSGTCVATEFGKVRSAGFIRKKILADIMSNPSDLQLWIDEIAAGNIVLMPFVTGTFDPGEPKQLKGYGRRPATRGPREQTLVFSDPSYVLNYAFYNSLHRHTDFVPLFRTSTSLHIGMAICDVFAQNEIEEDLEVEVVWKVTSKVRHTDLPFRFDVSPIEDLFQTVTQQATILDFTTGASIQVNGLREIAAFRVGAIGSPMAPGDTIYTNSLLVGQKVLVMATGFGLPVDYLDGAIDWTGSIERHVEKAIGSNSITFPGSVPDGDIIEIYAFAP
jgi:hypothetical protein